MVADVTEDLIGLCLDMGQRPVDAISRKDGGPLRTDAGDTRGPTVYQVVGAWVKTWIQFPQITLAGAFVQTGLVSRAQAAAALTTSEDMILAGLQDLKQRQKAWQKLHRWIHPEPEARR